MGISRAITPARASGQPAGGRPRLLASDEPLEARVALERDEGGIDPKPVGREQALAPRGVGVVIEAVHLCTMMRAVEKQNSKTITSALRGQFRECPMTRDEFLRLAHLGP